MAYVLLFLGVLLVITGVRDTYSALGAQLLKDFSGSGSFLYWIVAIMLIGAIGYYAPAQKFSRTFLALLLIVFVVAQKGLWAQLQATFAGGIPQAPAQTPTLPTDIPVNLAGLTSQGQPIKVQITQGGGGGLGGLLGGGGGGGIGGIASLAAG